MALNYEFEIGIQQPDHGVPMTITIDLGATVNDPVDVAITWDEDDGWHAETVTDVRRWCAHLDGRYATYQVAYDALTRYGVSRDDLPSARQLELGGAR